MVGRRAVVERVVRFAWPGREGVGFWGVEDAVETSSRSKWTVDGFSLLSFCIFGLSVGGVCGCV